jgi:transcriptional regulator with XRE-family HTH domain
MTLRELAQRAGTSHSTLAAYEAGRKAPTLDTFDRILRASGVELRTELQPAIGGPDRRERGQELIDALELAAMFPARHEATLTAPAFPRSPAGVPRPPSRPRSGRRAAPDRRRTGPPAPG